MDAQAARRFYEDYVETIYHRRQLEQLGRFYAADVVPHPPIPGVPPGLEGLKLAVAAWVEAFADFHFTIEDFVYDGRIMAPRLRITARHTGTFLGIPATGRSVDITDHPHYRMAHGKVAEYWDVPDLLTLMQQLGALPAPG